MLLEDIIKGMNTREMQGDTDIQISSVTCDSRKVNSGSLFVAVKGTARDGHEFIHEALKRGASAIISEESDPLKGGSGSVPIIQVEDSRDSLAFIADIFHGKPSAGLSVIGITGTNGKTTTAYILKHILDTYGKKTGLIGTIKYMIGDREIDALYTTPEAVEYQSLLKDMKGEGCEYVVSEVSSHSLAQKRVDYTRFDRAVFTNLSRDHLDFHGTMDDYLLAKKRLFVELLDPKGVAVLNADDPRSLDIVKDINREYITYGVKSDADIVARDVVIGFERMQFTIHHDGMKYALKTPLLGIPNVYNILAAFAAALTLGVPGERIFAALSSLEPVSGRFETIRSDDGVLYIVDYAHTPDALENLLQMVKSLSHKRITTVFGCGGDRDRGKRPLMGHIAEEMSDLVILTSDNPRFEDPEDIIEDIKKGMKRESSITITDRGEAIKEAVERAEEGDIVVVAGKGHESYQEIRGVRYPMNDRELVLMKIGKRGAI